MERSVRLWNRFFFVTGMILLGSEAGKQLLLTFSVGKGHYLWWYFPFQLCSIPMYLLPLLPFLKGEKRRCVLAFLSTFTLLGAMAVFLDTSGMHYALSILTVHSYLWHVVLILSGLAAGFCLVRESGRGRVPASRYPSPFTQNARLSWRTFLHAALLYGMLCLVATVLNLTLSRFGTINMFYISPRLPMEQIVFRHIARIWGNGAGILSYVASTFLGSAILYAFWRLLFRHLAEHPQDIRSRR